MQEHEYYNNILKQPLSKENKYIFDIPFANYIMEAGNDDRNWNHFCKIMEGAENIINGKPENILSKEKRPPDSILSEWNKMINLLDLQSEYGKLSFRLQAFLHDIGKYLDPAKHPVRGLYLINNIPTKDKPRLIKIIGPQGLFIIQQVVSLHDIFGVISTGEAAFRLIAEGVTRPSCEDKEKRELKTLARIFIINSIDIAASVPWGLTATKLTGLISDWKTVSLAVSKSGGCRCDFERILNEEAIKDEYTILRLTRIMFETYLRVRESMKKEPDFNAAQWPDLQITDFADSAYTALETVCGSDWDSFKNRFASVCKLDYFLSFADLITKNIWEKYTCPEKLGISIMTVIKRLIDEYSHMSRNGNTRIGIDCSALRNKAIAKPIANLLTGDTGDMAKGLGWLVRETSPWIF